MQQLLAARCSLASLLVRLVELELGYRLPNQGMRHLVDGLLRMALGRRRTVWPLARWAWRMTAARSSVGARSNHGRTTTAPVMPTAA